MNLQNILSSTSVDQAFHSREIAVAIATHTKLSGATSIIAAEFIQQLHYWTQKGSGILQDGVRWIYNSYRQWIDTQFPTLSNYYLRTIKNALVQISLIKVSKLRDKQWVQTYHYALDYNALFKLLNWKKQLEPLKTSNVKSVNDQRSKDFIIDDQNCSLSYTKNTSIEDLQRENIEQITFKKNASTQTERAEAKDSDTSCKNDAESFDDTQNLSTKTSVPLVDEKVNADIDKPITREKMAHYPEGDRYFQVRNQQSEIRNKAKMHSAVGMSGFKDVEEMERCEDELVEYYLKSCDRDNAIKKAHWDIVNAVERGKRSPLIRKDFLKGLPIGTHCKTEWELEPGLIYPVFISYLRCKLRKDKDTREHCNVKVHWYLKNSPDIADSWNECKRLINIEKPRLLKAYELGQNPVALNIPEWIIDAYRPVVSAEQITETAEVLGAIAEKYVEQLAKSNQVQYLESQTRKDDAEKVVSSHKTLNLAEILPHLPQTKLVPLQSEIEKITDLLRDPITREVGIKKAKASGLPLLCSDEGIAIAIDIQSLNEADCKNINRDGKTDTTNRYKAHEVYQPEKIEKGGLSALKKAIAKSKFLTNRGKTMN